MQYRNLEEKNDALSTCCSVLLLRHLICTFLAVSYFQCCYEGSWLPKEYQKVKYFCLLCNHKEVTLGRTLEWTFCGSTCVVTVVIVNTELMSYLLVQPFCYLISVSPFLTRLVFFEFWLLYFWHHFPSISVYTFLPLSFSQIFIFTLL